MFIISFFSQNQLSFFYQWVIYFLKIWLFICFPNICFCYVLCIFLMFNLFICHFSIFNAITQILKGLSSIHSCLWSDNVWKVFNFLDYVFNRFYISKCISRLVCMLYHFYFIIATNFYTMYNVLNILHEGLVFQC